MIESAYIDIHPYARLFFNAIKNNGGHDILSYEKRAVNRLVQDLITFNLFNKMIAFYPYVGRNATSHSFNLINPGLWQITWSGTVTHNENGVQSNGSSGFGNTGIPILNFSQFNISIGSYRRSIGTNAASLYPDWGSSYTPTGNTDRFFIGSNSTDTTNQNGVLGFGAHGAGSTTQGSLTGTGFKAFSVVGNGTSDLTCINNGAITFTGSGNQTWQAAGFLKLLSCSTFFGTQNIALQYVSTGLTNAESVYLYNIIRIFQENLNRAV